MNTQPSIDINRALRNSLAIVMAGGRGARLMNLTESEAKPAMPFGGKYRIIDFTLSNCINSGLRRIAVLTQYKSHTLIHHLQRGWGFLRAELNEFVELWPAQQQTPNGSWYKSTADAVFQNLDLIREHDPAHVIILGGDHIYKQDYGSMLADHIEKSADVTVGCLAVPRMSATGFGVVHVDDNDFITDFIEKSLDPPCIPGQPDMAFASMGIYIFNRDYLLEALKTDACNPDSDHDFGKNVIPNSMGKAKVLAHRFDRSCIMTEGATEPYWRDVGTVDAYYEANMDLTAITPSLDMYDPNWPIWTYQRQLPPAKFIFDNDGRRGQAIDSLVSAGCIVSGASIHRSLLFSGVRVRSYALVEDTVILPGSEVGRHSRIRRAVIDSGCILPKHTIIGENSSHDAERFHVTDNGVILVTRTMVDKLRHEMGIAA
ncbi:MAG: glucose-1-phosphate adenylyltransferase [Pseudomonadota bacterium]|nr:glucose-1-phosphate adenylyltransferase [Pseudomonadota bacterium]